MKNLSHLPEKFAFKLDDLGKRWIKETFGSDYYDDEEKKGIFHYPQLYGEGFSPHDHLMNIVHKDYTLISTSQLFPQPQIPTIEKGVMMLVWENWEPDAKEREVMFFDGKNYHTKNGSLYSHAKPIPQIPEYTIEEAEKKFNIKIKQ